MVLFWIFAGLAVAAVVTTGLVATRAEAQHVAVLHLAVVAELACLYWLGTLISQEPAAALSLLATVVLAPGIYGCWAFKTKRDAVSLALTACAATLTLAGSLYLYVAFVYGGYAVAILGFLMLTAGSLASGFGLLSAGVVEETRGARTLAAVVNSGFWAVNGLAWMLLGGGPVGAVLVLGSLAVLYFALRQVASMAPRPLIR